MTNLTDNIQRTGIHCANCNSEIETVAIGYVEACNARDLVKEACMDAIENIKPEFRDDLHAVFVEQAIDSIRNVK